MAILQAITHRRAFRAFSDEPLEKEVLLRLAEAAHLAPSSMNKQPWRMITVCENPALDELKTTLSRGNYWALPAPVITAFITNPSWGVSSDGRVYPFFELGMAAMAYQIQAVEEHLYVHPIAGFDAKKAKTVLGIGEDEVLEILMVVGRPGSMSHLSESHLESELSPRNRKDLSRIVAFNRWDDALYPDS